MLKKSKPGKGNETNDPKCKCSLHNHRERNYSMGLENFSLTSGPWEDVSSGQIELQGLKQNPLKLFSGIILLMEMLLVFLRCVCVCVCCVTEKMHNYVIIPSVFKNYDSQLWGKGDIGLKNLNKIPIILNLNWKY